MAVDTGCNTLDWFSEMPARMQRMRAAWESHYIEPRVAALWPMLTHEAGFIAQEIEPFTFCSTALEPDSIAFILLHLMSRYAVETGQMPEGEAQAWFDEQIALSESGRFFFSLTYYRMSAVKP